MVSREVKTVLDKLPSDLVKRAEELGIDVAETVEKRLASLKKKYSARTVISLAAAAVRREIEKKSAQVVKGLLVGMYDVYGFRAPIRFILARKSGEHIVFSNFGTHLKDGTEITVPSVAEVSLKADDYGYRVLEGKFTLVEPKKVAEMLNEVAVSPSDITEDYVNRAVVVKGVIARILPRTMFDNGEPVGHYPVLTKDAREDGQMWPTMEILLEREDVKRVRVTLERQRYGTPIYALEDLHDLCEEAISIEDPTEQAQFLQDAMQGREIIVCGVVRSYNKTRTASGEDIDYIDITAGGLYELEVVEEEVEEVEIDLSSPSSEEDEEEAGESFVGESFVDDALMTLLAQGVSWTPISKTAPAPDNVPVIVKKDKKDTSIGTIHAAGFSDGVIACVCEKEGTLKGACSECVEQPCPHVLAILYPGPGSKPAEPTEIDKLKKLIRAYCRALDLDLSDISEGTVTEKMGYKGSLAVVKEALRQLREEGI